MLARVFPSLCELSVFSCSTESSESPVASELLPAFLYRDDENKKVLKFIHSLQLLTAFMGACVKQI